MNVAGMNSFDVDSEERDEQINDGKDDLKKMLKNYNKNLIKNKNLYWINFLKYNLKYI